MGYGYYTLPDGREAGYNVEDVCNRDDCETSINRGMGCLCGVKPDGHRAFDEPGCGKYFCDPHLSDHECTNPACGYTEDDEWCELAAGHDDDHRIEAH